MLEDFRLDIGFHQIFLDDGNESLVTEPDVTYGFADVQGGSISIRTGIACGNVGATVEVGEATAIADHVPLMTWDELVEFSVSAGSSSAFVLHATSGLPMDNRLINKPAAPVLRVRVYAAHRHLNFDQYVEDSDESYWIQIWGEDVSRPAQVQTTDEREPIPPELDPDREAALAQARAHVQRQQRIFEGGNPRKRI